MNRFKSMQGLKDLTELNKEAQALLRGGSRSIEPPPQDDDDPGGGGGN